LVPRSRDIYFEWDFAEHDSGCSQGKEIFSAKSAESSGLLKMVRLYIGDDYLSLYVIGFQPVGREERDNQILRVNSQKLLEKRCADEFAEKEREQIAWAARVSPVARPAGNMAAWNSVDDYPSFALKHHLEGNTIARLEVGTDGRVTSCRVIASSGSAELDNATCKNAARRARFKPDMEENGTHHASTYDYTMAWRIPG
jgi:TonB family protein